MIEEPLYPTELDPTLLLACISMSVQPSFNPASFKRMLPIPSPWPITAAMMLQSIIDFDGALMVCVR